MGEVIEFTPKTLKEWKEFADKQTETIVNLTQKLSTYEQEIDHLKKLLVENTSLIGQGSVEKVIISPERALLDDQILMIQQRAYGKELSLEDVKKLDILLKNQKVLKDAEASSKGQSKTIQLSQADLLQIVQQDVKK